MPRVGHPWRKHLCDARFIVMEVDTSVMIILVMSWNTSTTAQVWLSWFCHKIVMDVHAWQKTRPTVTNTYCYLLSTALDFPEEERMMQQSSVSISLSFWEPRYQSSRRLHARPSHLHKQINPRNQRDKGLSIPTRSLTRMRSDRYDRIIFFVFLW